MGFLPSWRPFSIPAKIRGENPVWSPCLCHFALLAVCVDEPSKISILQEDFLGSCSLGESASESGRPVAWPAMEGIASGDPEGEREEAAATELCCAKNMARDRPSTYTLNVLEIAPKLLAKQITWMDIVIIGLGPRLHGLPFNGP